MKKREVHVLLTDISGPIRRVGCAGKSYLYYICGKQLYLSPRFSSRAPSLLLVLEVCYFFFID